MHEEKSCVRTVLIVLSCVCLAILVFVLAYGLTHTDPAAGIRNIFDHTIEAGERAVRVVQPRGSLLELPGTD